MIIGLKFFVGSSSLAAKSWVVSEECSLWSIYITRTGTPVALHKAMIWILSDSSPMGSTSFERRTTSPVAWLERAVTYGAAELLDRFSVFDEILEETGILLKMGRSKQPVQEKVHVSFPDRGRLFWRTRPTKVIVQCLTVSKQRNNPNEMLNKSFPLNVSRSRLDEHCQWFQSPQ